MITDFKELEKEAEIIQDFLEEKVPEELESILQRGHELVGYIARTGKMKADASYHLDQKKRSAIMQELQEKGKALGILPASTLNELVKANCYSENYLLNWCDRLNRSATHQLDWLRSVVSKEKEEMRLINGIGQK